MKGSREFFIHLTPGNLLSISSFRAFGRILQHGYLLTRHLPLFLNKAQLFFLLTSNMPSDAMVVESFLTSVSELDETILKSTLGKASFDADLDAKSMDIMNCYDIRGLPQANSFQNMLTDVAKCQVIFKPYCGLVYMSRKLKFT